MPYVSSRRPPWPGDVMLGVHKMMLVDGTMIAKKTQTLENVVPTDPQYGNEPIYKERTFDFHPTRGMGERVQSSRTSRRYRYLINCQIVGGLLGKGPLTHSLSPATTGSVRDFVEALHGGVLTQFILAGTNVLRRTNDTNAGQVVSETRGATATSAIRFKGAYATPVDGLYVAWSDGVLRQYNGAAWASATLPAGFLPQLLERVGDELWLADPTNSVVRKVTADPLLAASYSAAIQVGDTSVQITGMRQIDNTLVIFKADGSMFTLNSDGSDNDLFPGLRFTPDATNARTAQAGLDSLWFRIGQSFYRLSMAGGATLTPIGPERLRDNDSEVRGPVQAFAFWETFVGFGAIYNGTNSYLLSYGDWQPSADGSSARQFNEQWDGALVKWSSKQVTAMRVSAIASPDTRLYVGFSDGTWDYIKLVPNPFAADSGAEFTLSAATLYIPTHHAMFQADWKTFNGFSVFGPVLSATEYAQIAYRLDGGVTTTTDHTFGTMIGRLIGSLRGVPIGHLHGGTISASTSLAGSFTTPGMRIDTLPPTAAHSVDVEVSLINSTTATTPIIDTVVIHETVRPSLKRDYAGAFDVRNHLALRDGSTSRLTAEQMRDVVLQAAGAPASVTLTMTDETTGPFSFFGYQEQQLPRRQRNGLGWRVDFQATEFKTITVLGTIGRFKGVSFGDLTGTRIGQLRDW